MSATGPEQAFHLLVRNYTGHDMGRSHCHVQNGDWGSGGADVPPENIPDGGHGSFGGCSTAPFGGTQGSVAYTPTNDSNIGEFTIRWDIEFMRDPICTVTVPLPYEYTMTTPTGSDAHVKLVLESPIV
jgi:hypothetical protein